jgi:large subunit ribosomal protein L29
MNYTDLVNKDVNELKELLKEKKLELFTNKIKLKTMQLQDTSLLRKTKKDIARINTAISAKNR